MPLTDFQRSVCRILAQTRRDLGERYVAGGAALNESFKASRISHDIDLFHDTHEALLASWEADRHALAAAGMRVTVVRELSTFVEAEVHRNGDSVIVEWAHDSAFRFFPLIETSDMGLMLHPFDLATNKVLALIGRVEVRDWVDTLTCDERLQPFGCLVWAACGKDPGLNPAFILEQAARTSRYSREEIELLAFDAPPPDAARLGARWRTILREAAAMVAALPEEEIGTCVMTTAGTLFTGTAADLLDPRIRAGLVFHPGSIKGAFPRIRPARTRV